MLTCNSCRCQITQAEADLAVEVFSSQDTLCPACAGSLADTTISLKGYREQLLDVVDDLEITDEEAGEPQWAAYLTNQQLADAIRHMRPDATVPAEFAG